MKSNKLIAEFMGIVYPKLDNVIVIDNVVTKEDELQYHSSWDWLMPVVENCYHNGAEENEVGDITHALLDCDIDHLYISVVEFINQYNKTI